MSYALDEVETEEGELDWAADAEDAVEAQEGARSAECDKLDERAKLEERAASELAWFFGACDGTVPASPSDAFHAPAQTVAEALRRLLTFDRGALALMFTPRVWPEAIEHRLGSFASLVVRLECAGRPPEDGASLESLEQAAVKRLETKIAARRADIGHLIERAEAHERRAIRAYIAVRGKGAALVVSKLARKRAASRIGEGGDS
jgi:hypothetical protein